MRVLIGALVVGLFSMCAAIASDLYDGPLRAGIDELRIIGFSEDGAYFAFEMYGVDGESGVVFSYFNILDTRTNHLSDYSGIRSSLGDSDPPPPEGRSRIDWVREQAWQLAVPVLDELGFQHGSVQGRFLVSNSVGEIATEVEFVVYPAFPLAEEGVILSLRQYETPAPDYCLPDTVAAVDLVLEVLDGTRHVVHSGQDTPIGPGCPLRFTISDVMILDAPAPGGPTVVALLNYFHSISHGGLRRVVAIAFEMPEGAHLVR